jgi:hypothetical protein
VNPPASLRTCERGDGINKHQQRGQDKTRRDERVAGEMSGVGVELRSVGVVRIVDCGLWWAPVWKTI